MDHEVVCSHCQETFPARRSHFGNTVECPHCEEDVYLDPNDLPDEVSDEEKAAAKKAAREPLKRRPSEHGRMRRKPPIEESGSDSEDTTGTQPPGRGRASVAPRRSKSTPLLLGFGCFGLLIVGACVAGGVFMAFHVKDKSLREYASDRIYGEEYKMGEDRLLASRLATIYHDQARNTLNSSDKEERKSSGLFAPKEAYYDALKGLVDQTLAEMNTKLEVAEENMVGDWQRFGGGFSATLDLKTDGNFEYKMDDPKEAKTSTQQVVGQWKIKNGQFARRVDSDITMAGIVKLSANYLVLRNKDGSLEMYRKGGVTEPGQEPETESETEEPSESPEE